MTDKLEKLLDASKVYVEGLTPVQKRDMLDAQRKSWVIGELMLEHPSMSREEAERIYDRCEHD